MGLRSFSMSPAFIPTIKDLASHVTLDAAQAIFRRGFTADDQPASDKLFGEADGRVGPQFATAGYHELDSLTGVPRKRGG